MSEQNVKRLPSLTNEDWDAIQMVFSLGATSLLEAGWHKSDIGDFLNREDVREALSILQVEYNYQDAIRSRLRFNTMRNVGRLTPKALEVIESAMDGPEYLRGADGEVLMSLDGTPLVRRPRPHWDQIRAAIKVIERVSHLTDDAFIPRDPIRAIFRDDDDDDVAGMGGEDQSYSRQRIRQAMEAMVPNLSSCRERVQKFLAGKTDLDGKKVSKRKTSKRKTSKHGSKKKKKT